MGTVTETFQVPGSFDNLVLAPDTPLSVLAQLKALLEPKDPRDAVQMYIVVTPTRMRPDEVTALFAEPYDSDSESGRVSSTIRPEPPRPDYTGCLLYAETQADGSTVLSGQNLLWQLGDENRGQLVNVDSILHGLDTEYPYGIDPYTFSRFILAGRNWLPPWTWDPAPVSARWFYDSGFSPEPLGQGIVGWLSRRRMLNILTTVWPIEFRLFHHGHIDFGAEGNLVPGTSVIARNVASDQRLRVETLAAAGLRYDCSEVGNQIIMKGNINEEVTIDHWNRYDLQGRAIRLATYIERGDVMDRQLSIFANDALAKAIRPQKTVKVTLTDEYVRRGTLEVGQTAGVYDPAQFVVGDPRDTPLMIGGNRVRPFWSRITSRTWPMTAEHGVYAMYLSKHAAPGYHFIDLSDHFIPAADPMTVTIGDIPRDLIPEVPRTIKDGSTIMGMNPTGGST